MNEDELRDKAIAEVSVAVEDVATESRVVHCESETDWYPDLLRNLSEHRLNVLSRGADVIVFFDEDGNEIGWRDDGRTGTEIPHLIDRESFRTHVVRELDLPETAVLGRLRPIRLPPVGWTHEGVLFLSKTAQPDQVVRVWMDPEGHRVIQCLFGTVGGNQPREEPV